MAHAHTHAHTNTHTNTHTSTRTRTHTKGGGLVGSGEVLTHRGRHSGYGTCPPGAPLPFALSARVHPEATTGDVR